MINEQRALATLDLALKNAFETLNKYSLWARTPEESVTFNLVDAVPTLDNQGSGLFLKPITIPSFASMRSTMFGPSGANGWRDMYWNLHFKAVNGWSFEKFSQNSPTKLTVKVDSIFGSKQEKILIDKINLTENLIGSSLVLDQFSSIKLLDQFILDSSTFKAYLKNISLGKSDSNLTLLGNRILLGMDNNSNSVLSYQYARNNSNVESASIVLGPNATNKQSIYSTTIRTGSMLLDFIEGLDLNITSRSNNSIKSLISAKYSNNAYNVTFIEDGFKINSLLIGDVKSTSIFSSVDFMLSSANSKILIDSEKTEISANKLNLISESSLSVKSNTSVNIGITDALGNVSDEIIVNKGRVSIPNLYVQKSRNYNLSGLKHISPLNENPSVKYIPNNSAKTIPSAVYAYEYTKDTKKYIKQNNNVEYYDSCISDISSDLKSYLFKIQGASIKLYTADVVHNAGDYSIVSQYQESVTVTGLSSPNIYKVDPQLRVFSTPNGIYLMFKKKTSLIFTPNYSVYFSSNGVDFQNIADYNLNFYIGNDVSVDYSSDGTTDYIWFSMTYEAVGENLWQTKLNSGYTYNINYLENRCVVGGGVITDTLYPLNSNGDYQVALEDGPYSSSSFSSRSTALGPTSLLVSPTLRFRQSPVNTKVAQYVLVGRTCKVLSYPDSGDGSYCYSMNVFSTKTKNKHASKVAVVKYSYDNNKITQTIVHSMRDDSLVEGEVVDFTYSAGMGYCKYASVDSIRTFTLNSTSFTSNLTSSIKYRTFNKLFISRALTKVVYRSLVFANKKAIKALNDSNVFTSEVDVESSNVNLISTNGYAYYNQITESMHYEDDDLPPTQINSAISINEPILDYDTKGLVLDYIGLNSFEFGDFFTSFILTSDNSNPYQLIKSTDNSDRSYYIEKNNEDVSTIIESSESIFNPTNISKVLKLTGDSNKSILVYSTNTYSPNGFFTEPRLISNSSNQYVDKALNAHIEILSYIAKNYKSQIHGVKLAGYTVNNTGLNTFSILLESNKYSGYRIPYHLNNVDGELKPTSHQLNISYMGDGAYDDNDLKCNTGLMYISIISDSILVLHDLENISASNTFMVFPISLLDPNNPSYDSTKCIVNEFNNVVSIKCDNVYPFRARSCGPVTPYGKTNLVLGLTEVSEVGGEC